MTADANNTIAAGTGAVRMRGISKRFGPVQALWEVDFDAAAGTVHAVVGENGAGKSTLVKILAGLYRPDAGRMEIAGRVHRFAGPREALAAGVTMIYQDPDLAEHLTVAENVFLGNEPGWFAPGTVNRRAMVEQTLRLADSCEFCVDPTAVVAGLSAGDCQVVEILKALARRSRIIVMDEPTSSLSETEVGRLFGMVRTLRRRGICVVYISHRLEEIVNLADEITVLRDGRRVHSSAADGLDIGLIVRHMVGRELTEFFPPRRARPGGVMARVRDLSAPPRLREISFDVASGEIVGMAGLVGAGRTDLARAIFGLEKHNGTVELDGRELSIGCPSDAIRSGIALLTEDRKRTGLFLQLACSWNVTIAGLDRIGMRRFIRPARENGLVADVCGRLDVRWSSPASPAESLSGGNQQKLLVARWLLAASRFLMFDEPTRGIDVGAKKEIYVLLDRLASEGKAILFISSELPELLGVTDRILVMRRGRLVGDLVTRRTTQDEIMHLAAVEAD
jgi:ABC-type sugar transport system ATPase subunit